MFKRTFRLIALCVVPCALLGAGVANASAATLYVSSAPPVVGGKSCAHPGYNKVQDAITASLSGGTVDVCSGTYTEQLTIAKAIKLNAINGAGTATVAMPATPANATSTCDTELGAERRDEISICTSETVTIVGLSVQAVIPLETCAGELTGIFLAGGGTLRSTNVAIDGASTSINSYKGCQLGVAVQVGANEPVEEVGHAVLNKDTVSGYQKNGPTVKGTGSTLSVIASTITGVGPSPYIAQNGIEAWRGKATVTSSTISGDECNVGSCGATGEQASGVLFFEAAKGSSVTSSTVEESDLGVYYASGSATVPATPDLTVTKDVLTSNRYEGVLLEEGKASLVSDTINGSGRVGIDLYQAKYQTSASESKATGTSITGQSEAAIKVESDKSNLDIAGKFTFANGTATGNGAVLINESNNFEVIF
jgi:nitrous oxidase accessory protein NosD